MTRQRTAIIDVLQGAGRPLAPGEILDEAGGARGPGGAGGADQVSLSTVYRSIRWLERQGHIVAVDVPGQPPRYELAETAAKHHHHFHCVGCDRVFDVGGCLGGIAQMTPDGFEVIEHAVTLIGRCRECVSSGKEQA